MGALLAWIETDDGKTSSRGRRFCRLVTLN
jgi:hypothetical protein